MSRFTRKFVDDRYNIYVSSNGVILKESIKEFVRQTPMWMDAVASFGENVGWCEPDKVLMIDGHDKVYRIDKAMYQRMLQDNTTRIKREVRDGVVKIEYDTSVYSDDALCAEQCVWRDSVNHFGPFTIIWMENLKAGSQSTLRDRVITSNKNMVYTVDESMLIAVDKDECHHAYGKLWRDYIEEDEQHRGCLDMTDSALLISFN